MAGTQRAGNDFFLLKDGLNYGEGGLQNGMGGGGQVKFYPYKKKGGGGVLAILKGGGQKSFGVVLTQVLEVLTRGCVKCFPCVEGGAQKVLDV